MAFTAWTGTTASGKKKEENKNTTPVSKSSSSSAALEAAKKTANNSLPDPNNPLLRVWPTGTDSASQTKPVSAPSKSSGSSSSTPAVTTPTVTATAPTLSLPGLYELPSVDSYGSQPVLGTLPGIYQLPSVDSYGSRPVLGTLPEIYQMPSIDSYGEKPVYEQSQAVTDALNTYQQYLASKPDAYKSNYQGQIDTLLQSILDRPAFEYDFTTDPMYQQYKSVYTEQGRRAAADATAGAAALTGGYGNSYAATAGNQAYQNQLQNLNNVIPDLWQMAYDVWRNEGADQRSDMNLLLALEDMGYGRYRDTVSDWQSDRDFAYNVYDRESERDYGRYRDDVLDWERDRDFKYGADLDRLNASINERDFAYQQYRDTVSDWESDRAFDYNADLDRYNASVAERDFAYNQYLNELAAWQDSRDFAYGADMDRYGASVDERNFAYQQYLDALNQYNYENEFAYQQQQDALDRAARSSGGGSGSSSKNSSGYSDIAKGVKDRTGMDALGYLDAAVENGIITVDEADYLSVINGLSYGGGSSNGGSTSSSTPVFNQTEMSAREAYLRRRVQSKDATSAEINELDRILMAKKG